MERISTRTAIVLYILVELLGVTSSPVALALLPITVLRNLVIVYAYLRKDAYTKVINKYFLK